MSGKLYWLCLMVGMLLTVPSNAQRVDVAVEWRGAETADIRFDIEWARSLRESVDSLGLVVISPGDLERLGTGLTSVDHLVELAGLSPPLVSVVGVNFDELALPPGPGFQAPKRALAAAAAEGVGVYRKRPVASVVAPAIEYDSSREAVRRYSQVILRVQGIQKEGGPVQSQPIANPHLFVTTSKLADGTIFRIPITEEGIYRIDRDLLSAIGLNPDTVEPNNLHILGNGGRPVPALNSDPRPADLVENRVFVRGGGDGRFDSGDVLLFYASGPTTWDWAGDWSHTVHPYSRDNAYFLKVDATPGLRVAAPQIVPAPGLPVRQTGAGRYVVDFEEQIWSREHESGTDWMSNTIRVGGTRDLLSDVTLTGLQTGEIRFNVRAAVASNPRAAVNFESGGQVLDQRLPPWVVLDTPTAIAASAFEANFTSSATAGQPIELTMRLLEQINEPTAAADYVRVFYDQLLDGSSGYVRTASPDDVTGNHVLEFTGFAQSPVVWDVTDPRLIRSVDLVDTPQSAQVMLTRADGERPRELVAFVESAARALTADVIAPVVNQNLHGITGFPDLAIVTPTEFLEAAEELADMRRADGLEVVVVQTFQLYNEFSGGLPDPRAVRDYFRFLYDRATTDDEAFRYGLLFGDGHYDYRELAAREGTLTNWVFPFETDESLDTDASYTSDDYFGLLDAPEGRWIYLDPRAVSSERVDIGIGRIPAQSLAEARMIVDKIRRYESPETFGSWRTQYTFLADDGPTGLLAQQNDADLHLQNTDHVAELVRREVFPEIDIKKIYAESFDRVFQNGFRVPDAKKAVNAALNQGTLLFNYSGHGGPDGLAQEELFTKEDAIALTNKDKLAVFVTATCSFGWWDLQADQSGAEALLLNPEGGAVALLTTVRLVFTSRDTLSLNVGLNRALNIELFREAEDGGPRRLGDALRAAKNTPAGLQGNSRKLNLLGDPTMRLGLPHREVAVESLNGVQLDQAEAQMKALDRVTIAGTVLDPTGQVDASFNGQVSLTVFDALRNVPLVEQRHMLTPYYRIREDLIWRGAAAATRGEWSATFVVPKDISYSNLRGRISAYALSDQVQGLGYSESFLVGGTSDNPPNDQVGPEISLFLNDTTFVAGETTPADAELIVKLFDESGINTVGAGVGHEMLLVVNGDESGATDIGSAFTSEAGSFQRGEVRWPLTFDQAGPGTLSVRAWDVLNNSGASDLEFVVSTDEVLRLRNVYNYPNPMSERTRFVFEHNQSQGTPARVRVRVFSLNGTPVRTIRSEEALPGGILTSGPVQILWDGRDDDLDRIGTGIYLYQLRVEVDRPDGTTQASEITEKLAIIR